MSTAGNGHSDTPWQRHTAGPALASVSGHGELQLHPVHQSGRSDGGDGYEPVQGHSWKNLLGHGSDPIHFDGTAFRLATGGELATLKFDCDPVRVTH